MSVDTIPLLSMFLEDCSTISVLKCFSATSKMQTTLGFTLHKPPLFHASTSFSSCLISEEVDLQDKSKERYWSVESD